MKLLMALSIALFAFGASADDLSSKKDMMNKHLDEKIAKIQEAKTCVSAATTEAAVHKCKETLKSEMEMMKKDHKKMMKK
jgi:hypothetical protein